MEHSVRSAGRPAAAGRPEWTIGLDLGDRWSQSCVLDAGGAGLAKSCGERLAKCSSGRMGPEVAGRLSAELQPALGPVLVAVWTLTEQIRDCGRRMERMRRERYPELGRLTQVSGVGVLTALTWVLRMEDAGRCRRSREAGCAWRARPADAGKGFSEPS